MEQDYRLAEGEYRFACLVWANEPLGSGQLVALANEALGWKKSTTYTVLKKLCERGILHNANGTVTALVKQAQVQQEESAAVVQKSFGGSLPRFVAAFLNTSSISEEEAADDEYEEDAEGINEEAEAEMDDVNELEDADDELGDTADNSGAADDAGLRLHRAGVYGRHHPDCSRLYVLRWPRAARRRRRGKTTGRGLCPIRSSDYDRTYSGCVW